MLNLTWKSAKKPLVAILCGLGIAISTIIILACYIEITNIYSRVNMLSIFLWLTFASVSLIACCVLGGAILFKQKKIQAAVCGLMPSLLLLTTVFFYGKTLNGWHLVFSLIGGGFIALVIITFLIKREKRVS
jgi:hypothetical protein